MGMKKKTAAVALAGVIALSMLLTGCGAGAGKEGGNEGAATTPPSATIQPADNAEPEAGAEEGQAEEEGESEGLDWLENADLGNLEAPDWDNVHLTKKDFLKMLAEMGEPDADGESPILSIDLTNDTTIDIVLDTEGEGGQFISAFMAAIFDPILRQLYIHSDYYKNEQQPLIRFLDPEGGIIAENSDFIDYSGLE